MTVLYRQTCIVAEHMRSVGIQKLFSVFHQNVIRWRDKSSTFVSLIKGLWVYVQMSAAPEWKQYFKGFFGKMVPIMWRRMWFGNSIPIQTVKNKYKLNFNIKIRDFWTKHETCHYRFEMWSWKNFKSMRKMWLTRKWRSRNVRIENVIKAVLAIFYLEIKVCMWTLILIQQSWLDGCITNCVAGTKLKYI
jgi:hypothetical protein